MKQQKGQSDRNSPSDSANIELKPKHSPNSKAIVVVQSWEQRESEFYGLNSFCGILPKLTGQITGFRIENSTSCRRYEKKKPTF